MFTLIIPAHNEEAVIERCLKTALAAAPDTSSFDIIVAANGCTDATVEKARKAVPEALVLDLDEGSKTAAINAANSAAKAYPHIILDADVECDYRSLVAIADALREPGVMVAAPAIKLDLGEGNPFIKAYYRAWMKQPFAKAGKGGAGCYGLSEAAIAEIGQFPKIIGDDIWIHTRFREEQRRFVTADGDGGPVSTIVRPPRTAWGQVRVEVRRMFGNQEVRQEHPSPHLQTVEHGDGVKALLKSGASPFEMLAFVFVKVMVRIEMRRAALRHSQNRWVRDDSSRG